MSDIKLDYERLQKELTDNRISKQLDYLKLQNKIIIQQNNLLLMGNKFPNTTRETSSDLLEMAKELIKMEKDLSE